MENVFKIDINKMVENKVSIDKCLFMFILKYKPDTNISLDCDWLVSLGLIKEHNFGYILTEEGDRFLDEIKIEETKKGVSSKMLQDLAEQLRELFPDGKKPDTNKYWRDNRSNVIGKLNAFYKANGYYSPEKIIEATKKYVNSFGDNKKLMRILPYFIMKDNVSELLTVLDNFDSVEENSNDDGWTSTLI